MKQNVNILTLIEARHDECLSKDIYVYNENDLKAINKFNTLVREILIKLAHNYLEDEIEDINEATNEDIIEELSEAFHYITYDEDGYFNFVHEDGTIEIDIDMETYEVN